MDAVKAPALPTQDPTIRAWTLAQVRQFLGSVTEDRFYALWHLAAWTGLRRGELLGLKWQDLELNNGICSVRRSRIAAAGGTIEVGPKTSQGKRSVELDMETVRVMKQLRLNQAQERLAAGTLWHDSGLVFDWQDGSGLSPYWASHRFKQLVGSSGLPSLTLHGLRHSHATALLAAGVHPKITQERLGHHSAAFTMDVYSAVLPTMQREALERLSEGTR